MHAKIWIKRLQQKQTSESLHHLNQVQGYSLLARYLSFSFFSSLNVNALIISCLGLDLICLLVSCFVQELLV